MVDPITGAAAYAAAKIAGIGVVKAGKAIEDEIKDPGIDAESIQWPSYPDRDKDIVWKYPGSNIKWGAALIVREYETAGFYRDGKLYDVFGPGRHILTSANLPLLGKLQNLTHNKPIFRSDIFFVSSKEFDGLFGGRSQTKELFPLLANGQYWFKVTDPTLFLNEVVGGKNVYTTLEIVNFLRGFVNQNMIKELAGFDLASVFTEGLDSTSLKMKSALYDKLARFGLDLFDLKFNSIDTEERYRELAAMVKQGVSASEVLRMFTLRESAKELGKSEGGAALGAGFVLPQMVSQMPQQQEDQKKEDPLQVLKMRFAKGEITEKEYEKRKKILED
jgi:membrane protease subunit (stomatin/prohibitin family)